MSKKYIIIFTFIFLFIFLLIYKINYNNSIKYKVGEFINKNDYLTLKRIIIIGDSRMELIAKERNKINIPNSIDFIAKSGATIDWLKKDGIPDLYKSIKNDKYEYSVLFNLGVNDLAKDINIYERVGEYFKLYNNIYKNNTNINFYFLSVNPIDELKFKEYWNDMKITNKKIQYFNKYMKKYLKTIDKIKFCDSNSTLNFNLPDGLHFDYETNKVIIKYILNDCINVF